MWLWQPRWTIAPKLCSVYENIADRKMWMLTQFTLYVVMYGLGWINITFPHHSCHWDHANGLVNTHTMRNICHVCIQTYYTVLRYKPMTNPGCAGRIQGERGDSRVHGDNPGCAGRIQGERGESRVSALTKKHWHFTMVSCCLPWRNLTFYHGEMVFLGSPHVVNW
jgi:hypothetical protein